MGVFKNGGKHPKMDGENIWKNRIKMDDLGEENPTILGNHQMALTIGFFLSTPINGATLHIPSLKSN